MHSSDYYALSLDINLNTLTNVVRKPIYELKKGLQKLSIVGKKKYPAGMLVPLSLKAFKTSRIAEEKF